MARESLTHTDRRVLFREVFTPESIARNAGVITGGVTFNPDGVATFDGTGYITYAGNKDLANKTRFTIRAKMKRESANKQVYLSFLTNVNHRVELLMYTDENLYAINQNGASSYGYIADPNNDSGLYDLCMVFDGSGATDADKLKLYVDGTPLTLSWAATIPTISITLGTFYIGKGFEGNSEGSFELVEIYDSALSPEEASLLSRNALYKGAVR